MQQSAMEEWGELGQNTTIVGHIRGRWAGKENTTTNQIRGEKHIRMNADGGGGGKHHMQHNNHSNRRECYFVACCLCRLVCSVIY
eukprot:scaffold31391_cov75-Cyclotella_meneghiniana.AAC.12